MVPQSRQILLVSTEFALVNALTLWTKAPLWLRRNDLTGYCHRWPLHRRALRMSPPTQGANFCKVEVQSLNDLVPRLVSMWRVSIRTQPSRGWSGVAT